MVIYCKRMITKIMNTIYIDDACLPDSEQNHRWMNVPSSMTNIWNRRATDRCQNYCRLNVVFFAPSPCYRTSAIDGCCMILAGIENSSIRIHTEWVWDTCAYRRPHTNPQQPVHVKYVLWPVLWCHRPMNRLVYVDTESIASRTMLLPHLEVVCFVPFELMLLSITTRPRW